VSSTPSVTEGAYLLTFFQAQLKESHKEDYRPIIWEVVSGRHSLNFEGFLL
jgi:hypothetical protein